MSADSMMLKGGVNVLSQVEDIERRLAIVEKRAAGIPGVASLVLTLLSDTKLTAATASFDIVSINQSYKHLLLIGNLRGDTASTNAVNQFRFNGITSANYYSQYHAGAAATASAGESIGATSAVTGLCTANTAPANMMGKLMILIPDYTEPTRLPGGLFWIHAAIATTTGNVLVRSGGFSLNVAGAVTQITLFPSAGNYNTDSRLTLYGIG